MATPLQPSPLHCLSHSGNPLTRSTVMLQLGCYQGLLVSAMEVFPLSEQGKHSLRVKLELHYIFCAASNQCAWEQTKWLAQGHNRNQWHRLIQSFSKSLQSSRAPSSCPHGVGSSFIHLFGKQMAERMLLQTRVLEKSFLLDSKSQPQESIQISKSNKLLEAFPFNNKLSVQGETRHTQNQQRSHTCSIEKSRKKLSSTRQESPTVLRSEDTAVLASSRARQDWLNSLSVSRGIICESFQRRVICRHLIINFCRGEVSAEKHFSFCLLPACLVPHTSFSFIKMDGSIKIERK